MIIPAVIVLIITCITGCTGLFSNDEPEAQIPVYGPIKATDTITPSVKDKKPDILSPIKIVPVNSPVICAINGTDGQSYNVQLNLAEVLRGDGAITPVKTVFPRSAIVPAPGYEFLFARFKAAIISGKPKTILQFNNSIISSEGSVYTTERNFDYNGTPMDTNIFIEAQVRKDDPSPIIVFETTTGSIWFNTG